MYVKEQLQRNEDNPHVEKKVKHRKNELNRKVKSILNDNPSMSSEQIAEEIEREDNTKTSADSVRQTDAWKQRNTKKSCPI